MKKFNSIKNLFKLLYYQINPRFDVQVERRQNGFMAYVYKNNDFFNKIYISY